MRLELFKQKEDYVYQFRCPFCGDSKKNKLKARGYFYRQKYGMSFQCHNCSTSISFSNFLSRFDTALFKDYRLELFQEDHGKTIKDDYSKFKSNTVFPDKKVITLPSIESLSDSHTAKKYVKSRKIPEKFWLDLYYAEDFLSFADATFSGHGKKLIKNDIRLVIPFYSKDGILQGVQGRSLTNSQVRYITLKASDESQKIFGLDRIDFNKQITVVEGPIDSMFLDNAVATMDGTLFSIIERLGRYDYVFAYDNTPRNKEIIKNMQKTINMKEKIVVWPNYVHEKDINDMVLSGLNAQSLVESNTYKDFEATLKFTAWRKI